MTIYRMPGKGELITRGLIALAVGIALLVWPDVSKGVVVALFAVLVFADALIKLIRVFDKNREGSAFFLVFGILIDVAVGVLVLAYPDFALKTLMIVLGVWAIVSGIIELLGAYELRGTIGGPVLAILGIISTIIGIVLVTNPGIALSAIVIVIGLYALLTGGTLLILAFFGPSEEPATS